MSRDLTLSCYCDEILDLIDNSYFHPSRDNEFPTLTIKYVAQCAMLRLWNTYELYMNRKRYDNHEIRRIMDEEMLPEDLFMAVRFLVYIGRTEDVKFLSKLIFWFTINNEEIVKWDFYFHDRNGCERNQINLSFSEKVKLMGRYSYEE